MELKIILMAMTMVPMEMMIAVKCNLQCNVAVFHSCSSGPANWGSGQLCNNSPIVVIIFITLFFVIISFITLPISSHFHSFPPGSSWKVPLIFRHCANSGQAGIWQHFFGAFFREPFKCFFVDFFPYRGGTPIPQLVLTQKRGTFLSKNTFCSPF